MGLNLRTIPTVPDEKAENEKIKVDHLPRGNSLGRPNTTVVLQTEPMIHGG